MLCSVCKHTQLLERISQFRVSSAKSHYCTCEGICWCCPEQTATCMVCIAYSLTLYHVGWGVASARLESVGKPCDPLTAVNRCYLTTPASIVRSLDRKATLSCFVYLNVLGFSLSTVWTLISQFYGKIGWELKVMVRKNERHFIREILSSFSKQLQNKNSFSTVLVSCFFSACCELFIQFPQSHAEWY